MATKRSITPHKGGRDTHLKIRASDAEKALFAERAKASGLSQIDYIMRLMQLELKGETAE